MVRNTLLFDSEKIMIRHLFPSYYDLLLYSNIICYYLILYNGGS